MSYFWANLGAHLLVSLIILLILLWAVKNTQQNRWKKGFLFLTPVVLMVILFVQMAIFSIPRVLDTTTVLRSTYHIRTGQIDKIGALGTTIVIDGTTYYVNPFSFDMEVGDEVTVKYTPYAHYAYSLEIYESDIQDEE
ncbi:MAG: hypothetical protein IK020_08305 [Clostridiales bacterium]|nr:hypothetical protein [Clostridiales bacterium]